MPEESEQKKKPSLWQVAKSALSAGFGVQSEKNRERDFKHGNIKVFVAAGIIFTMLFVLSVIGIVRLVTGLAGS